MTRRRATLAGALRAIVLAVVAVVAVECFVSLGLMRPVLVIGDSMAPSLTSGQRVSVRPADRPRRWDVVVLRSPVDARVLLVKRVVGLPGESISFAEGGLVVDGRRVACEFAYVAPPVAPLGWRLGPDEWFVVGDNQAVSHDSRNWDAAPGVPTRLIVGTLR
ncbi:MAG: signal peptidase I [Lacipirellulaceae bacterium]